MLNHYKQHDVAQISNMIILIAGQIKLWSDEGMGNFYVICGQWKKLCGAPSLHKHSDRIGMKNTAHIILLID